MDGGGGGGEGGEGRGRGGGGGGGGGGGIVVRPELVTVNTPYSVFDFIPTILTRKLNGKFLSAS